MAGGGDTTMTKPLYVCKVKQTNKQNYAHFFFTYPLNAHSIKLILFTHQVSLKYLLIRTVSDVKWMPVGPLHLMVQTDILLCSEQ